LYVLSIAMLLASDGYGEIYPRHAAEECRDTREAGAYGEAEERHGRHDADTIGHRLAETAPGSQATSSDWVPGQ
jgi:hypothetical protein